MHNRNKLYAANVLRQLKPILKKDARLLVSDYYRTEAGKNQAGVEGKAMRTTGINMLANLNAQETESDWVELFNEVKGFRFSGLKKRVRCGMNSIEAIREEEKH